MRFVLVLSALLATIPTLCLAEEMSRGMATGGCMLFIKQRLHDPDSAKFGHSDEAVVHVKGNRAMVIRSVRATNGFGALRLTEFMCLLELNAGTITPVFVAPKGENPEQARAILKKWALFEPAKNPAKR